MTATVLKLRKVLLRLEELWAAAKAGESRAKLVQGIGVTVAELRDTLKPLESAVDQNEVGK